MAKGTEVEHEEGVLSFVNDRNEGYVFTVSLTDAEISADYLHLIDLKMGMLRSSMIKYAKQRRIDNEC